MKAASTISAILVFLTLLLIGADIVVEGAAGLSIGTLTDAVRDGGRAGGLGPIILSTVIVLAGSILFALPLALGGAVLKTELLRHHSRLARGVMGAFEVMVSVPSVAIGLVGWSLFSQWLGLGFSLLSGCLTMTLIIVPIMTVAFIGGFEMVPAGLRMNSLALGVTRWQTFWRQVVPSARPALAAGVTLAIGRVTAETAALMLTSGISTRTPESLGDPGATLAVHVYHMARHVPGGESMAYTTSLALLLICIAVHVALARLKKESAA